MRMPFSNEQRMNVETAFTRQLYFGNSAHGEMLPDPARSVLESLFGVDLHEVRVHVSELPHCINAHAFAHGTDLYFTPDAYCTERREGLALIAHEIVHACRQQCCSGSVPTEPVRCLWNRREEALAECAQDSVLRGDTALGGTLRKSFRNVKRLSATRARWDVLQPSIRIRDTRSGQYRELTDLVKTCRELAVNCHGSPSLAYIEQHQEVAFTILNNWIRAPSSLASRFILGFNERTVQYNTWDELARAIAGETRVALSGNLEIEVALANAARSSTFINRKLGDFIEFVHRSLTRTSQLLPEGDLAKAHNHLTTQQLHGEYKHFYKPTLGLGKNVRLRSAIENPRNLTFAHKMAVIHDLVELFKPFIDCDVPDEKCFAWFLTDRPDGGPGGVLSGARMSPSAHELMQLMPNEHLPSTTFRTKAPGGRVTLDERNEIILNFRNKNIPTSFGPSFTTGRTAQMCAEVCRLGGYARREQTSFINAIAWGLFAFWTIDYDQRYGRAHTFHEVMTMALNYGVPYIPYAYPRNVPRDNDEFPTG